MSEDTHLTIKTFSTPRNGWEWCNGCSVHPTRCGTLCHFCSARAAISPHAPALPSPALVNCAWRTAHLHLSLAHAKLTQARELLAEVGQASELCNGLENITNWLDCTAIREAARNGEELRS